ncbi:UDP-glycosyltransferase 90A1-like protein [Cinnamomum micranthum f. kanehirae]|uniref:UDP-glycosyltransferase 90A1-like protein n=1 Tax=Cinnamomum micranthum f. kanehirae TaxID=337451 RepID=A0A443PVY8_9MAGN|nr:UDP-glycosyltransferase 90A1-like protein [Cinnamomum micranthum f. kanehirae]
MASPTPTTPHVVLFPFMSKGHTIPLLHLAHLFSCRGTTLTIFTTSANSPFIHSSITHITAKIVELTFPENVPEIPAGTESTDKLPSMDLFLPFVHATKLLRPHFEQALHTLPPITCIIYGAFMGWIQLSASKFNIPGLVFHGMNAFAMTISPSHSKTVPTERSLLTMSPSPCKPSLRSSFASVTFVNHSTTQTQKALY